MEQPRFQISVAGLLGVIACIALNVWLFRLGALWGILGANVTKHVVIAYLCQALGVDRRGPGPSPGRAAGAVAPTAPTALGPQQAPITAP